MFTASHATYPAFRHIFPDPAARTRALRAFFTATAADALRYGAVDAITLDNELLGVAVWLPPGRFPWDFARKLRSTPRMLRIALAAPRSFATFTKLGANAEHHHPRDSHWNLEALGVKTSAQGCGLGTRLMQPGLERADNHRLPCYLTTSRAENVPFYERFGFYVENEKLPLVPNGPTHWGMRRAITSR